MAWLDLKFTVWLFGYHPRVPAWFFDLCFGVSMRERTWRRAAGGGRPIPLLYVRLLVYSVFCIALLRVAALSLVDVYDCRVTAYVCDIKLAGEHASRAVRLIENILYYLNRLWVLYFLVPLCVANMIVLSLTLLA